MHNTVAFLVSRIFGPGTTTSFFLWYVLTYHTDLTGSLQYTLGSVTFITYVMIPLLMYAFFFLTGRISDIDITDKKERPYVFTAVQLSYTIGLLAVLYYGPILYTKYFLWTYVSTFTLYAVTFFYKASAHMMANTLLWLAFGFLLGGAYWSLGILLPLIGWSRHVQKKHRIIQLLVGGFIPVFWMFLLR